MLDAGRSPASAYPASSIDFPNHPRTVRKSSNTKTLHPEMISLLTEPIGVSHYMMVGALMFATGAVCMATKRNALGILMGIELVLNGANINFVALGSQYLRTESLGLDGQLIALFVIVLAAAEAAVALAIALNFYNNHGTIDVDQADDLKG